ncbi:MAG: TetR/AcrR family transcriptional regulator [Treponema sp.]|jgi:AcrR family transcriptional regulator|nr:TetR/AcrR family transcriptional regulator [Treponema sp.]
MTRQDIIRTALRVWGRELYQRTSLGDLARELGVSKAALYRHFTGKEELVKAVDEYFCDDYASFLKPRFDAALKVPDKKESILLIIRGIIEYYIRNRDLFVFSLIQVYRNWEEQRIAEQMGRRGIDIEKLKLLGEDGNVEPSLRLLLVTSLIFRIAHFHKHECREDAALSEGQIGKAAAEVEERLNSGLALEKSRIGALEYERLEALAAGSSHTKSAVDENDGLLRAVGIVVAEAGPWNASMEMVARRSGLSKSSLYAHFRNKRDMLRRLFVTEFDRIILLARKNIRLSAVPEEQLYLGIFSVVSYLRSRPEILVAMNWVRTRRPNLGRPAKQDRFRVFEGIAIEALRNDGNGHWIFFLILGMMTKWSKENNGPGFLERSSPGGGGAEGCFPDLPNGSIRRLYRFICLGFRGFEG